MLLKEKYKPKKKSINSFNNLNIILWIIKLIILLGVLISYFYYSKSLAKEKNIGEDIIEENSKHSTLTNKTKKEIYDKNKDFINNYLSSIPDIYSLDKNHEKELLEKYFSLIYLSDNETVNSELKDKILDKIYFYYKKNITSINKLIITNTIAFGNTLLCLNNVLFYCEILECKNIYLNASNNWYIKNKIVSNKTQISLIQNSNIDCNGRKTLCIPFEGGFCLNPMIIKQKIKLNIIKDEIKRNLPKVKVNPDDLYIHIRCGNIFVNEALPSYAQPPLCFYQKILKNFKFRKVYIISGSTNSPVFNELLKEFPYLIQRNNSLELDFSYLSNAYNLVGSVSSFLITSIKFNDNLKNYWEYDIYRKSEKIFHLHHDVYQFPKNFTIYKMLPSKKYKNEMFSWKNSNEQLKLMINENCLNSNFIVIKDVKKSYQYTYF